MILLDTNALLFYLIEPGRIGKLAQQAIGKSSFLYYSPISIAEMQIKAEKRSDRLLSNGLSDFEAVGLISSPFGNDASLAMDRFRSLIKTDPFDWMLLSQAASLSAEFFTTDQKLIELGLDFVVDASV